VCLPPRFALALPPDLVAVALGLALPAAALDAPLAIGLAAVGVAAFFLLAASADEGTSSESSAEAARKSRRFNRLSGKRRIHIARSRQHGSVAKNDRAVSQDTAR
jgi:hypothetical protein